MLYCNLVPETNICLFIYLFIFTVFEAFFYFLIGGKLLYNVVLVGFYSTRLKISHIYISLLSLPPLSIPSF